MQAYSPLSIRIFGATYLPVELRLQLLSVLVFSRLLFNIHIFDLSVNALRIIGNMYNRAMRRVAGVPRFCRESGAPSDLAVRLSLRVPSIDCVVMRCRLRYVGRVVRRNPATVTALLAGACHLSGGSIVPCSWSARVVEDLRTMRRLVARVAAFPDPGSDSTNWLQLMMEPGQWASAVSTLHFPSLPLTALLAIVPSWPSVLTSARSAASGSLQLGPLVRTE